MESGKREGEQERERDGMRDERSIGWDDREHVGRL